MVDTTNDDRPMRTPLQSDVDLCYDYAGETDRIIASLKRSMDRAIDDDRYADAIHDAILGRM